MSQNEFIDKPKNDIALSMPPLPAYPGPQESTKRDPHQVPGDIVVVFGQHSVITTCKNCNNQISTNVESSISGNGWAWAILCCCLGTWIASCLVICLPGFRKFTHFCPRCNVIVGEVEPNHSTSHNIIVWLVIGIYVLLVVCLIIAVFISNNM